MDFLDYVKMCQEETRTNQEENGRQQGTEGVGPMMEMPQMNRRQQGTEGVDPMMEMPQMNRRQQGTEGLGPEMRMPQSNGMQVPKGMACRGQVYKVKKGDTLYSISRQYDLRVRDLMQANPFVNVYNLQVGEELCIPVVSGRPETGVRPYVVKRDDTVLSILKQNRISFEELARLNRSAAVLKFPTGTVLLLP